MSSDSRTYPCNSCLIVFTTSALQRLHMRELWHLNNLRRRIAGEPPLPEQTNNVQAEVPVDSVHRALNDSIVCKSISSNIDDQTDFTELKSSLLQQRVPKQISSTQCLFCNQQSTSLDANLEHMLTTHSLYIPSQNQLFDITSLLRYLMTIIFEYHECLFCNQKKGSIEAVQTHMRDKGHCMISFDAESELLEFWDFSKSGGEVGSGKKRHVEAATRISKGEVRLLSGAIITSHLDVPQLRNRPRLRLSRSKGSQQKVKGDEMKSAYNMADGKDQVGSLETSNSRHNRHAVVRGQMGLAGASNHQKRALQVTEKKWKRREAIAKVAQQHAAMQAPKKTVYYKVTKKKLYSLKASLLSIDETENPVYQAG